VSEMTKEEMYDLCRHVKKQIRDEFRAFDGDDRPGIQLTVGYERETGKWNYQTGDNSFTGGAYNFENWAVVGVYRDSNCRELAQEILDQLEELEWKPR